MCLWLHFSSFVTIIFNDALGQFFLKADKGNRRYKKSIGFWFTHAYAHECVCYMLCAFCVPSFACFLCLLPFAALQHYLLSNTWKCQKKHIYMKRFFETLLPTLIQSWRLENLHRAYFNEVSSFNKKSVVA